MNEEPKTKLPEPPEGMKWEYRGLGFRKNETTICYCNEDNVSYVQTGKNAFGMENLHYWEAVDVNSPPSEIESLRSKTVELLTLLTDQREHYTSEIEKHRDAINKHIDTARDLKDRISHLEIIEEGYIRENFTLQNKLEAVKRDNAEKTSLITHRDTRLKEANETITRLRTAAKKQASDDPTEGGKYRLLEEGEMMGKEDQYFWHAEGKWEGVYRYNGHNKPFKKSYWGSDVRRPVEVTMQDHTAEARECLQRVFDYCGHARTTNIATFVDLILKAAKQ